MNITQAHIKYYGTLAEIWHGSKYILFSAFLSSVVVAWDVIFVLDHFTSDKFLAVIMMIAVELSYVVLPYMQEPEPELTKAEKEKRKWYHGMRFNQIMIIVFFIASMTPASLQISGQFLNKMIDSVRVEPVKPEKPEYDGNLDKDIQIYRYRVYKEIDLAESQSKLNELEKVKANFRKRIADYENDIAEYPKKLEAYKEFKAKGRLTWFFDIAMLIIGFVTMISLQVMNGYSSKKGAKEKTKIPETKKEEVIANTEPEITAPDFAPVYDPDASEKQSQPGE